MHSSCFASGASGRCYEARHLEQYENCWDVLPRVCGQSGRHLPGVAIQITATRH